MVSMPLYAHGPGERGRFSTKPFQCYSVRRILRFLKRALSEVLRPSFPKYVIIGYVPGPGIVGSGDGLRLSKTRW